MLKTINLYIISIYILPFIFLGGFGLSTLLTIIPFIMFLFGAFYFRVHSKLQWTNYSSFFSVDFSLMFFIFLLFLVSRYDNVTEVVTSLISGTYSENALANAIARYKGEKEDPGFGYQLGTISLFIFSILFAWVSTTRFGAIILFLCFVILIVVETSTLGRTGTVLALISVIVNLLIRFNNQISALSTKRFVSFAILFAAIIICLFLYSAVGRLSDLDDLYYILSIKLGEYLFGVYSAYTIWFKNNDFSLFPSSFGFHTFMGLFKILGVKVPDEVYFMTNSHFGETNLYTIMRGLVLDFGYLAINPIFLFCGFFMGRVSVVKVAAPQLFAVQFFMYIILFFVYSPFFIGTFFVAAVVANVLLLFSRLKL